ncbi:hypothetical protein NEOKW01_1827 [Nematocida sp. AWRm80]|nr:hypothetical protein NEOKW01_1827 [Nematocida sp. AWRm80]
MSRSKPLQLDEKVSRVLSLLREKDQFYSQKELEKIAQKEKGVVPQSMPEILEILVSENKISEKRVGSTRFYWSYPSDARMRKEKKKKQLQEELAKQEERYAFLANQIKEFQSTREPTPEREQKLAQYTENIKQLDTLPGQLQILAENSPQQITALQKEIEIVQAEANTWTETIFTIRSYLCEKYNIDQKTFNKNFSIADTMEEL